MWKARVRARKFLPGGIFTLTLGQVALAQSPPTSTREVDAFAVTLERDEQASSCPDVDWFRARIAAHAGEFGQAGTFKLVLGRRGDAWQAKIQRWEASRSAPAAERTLFDRSTACEPLAQAVVVTVAILADDFAQHPESQPPPASAPVAVAPRRAEPPPAPQVRAEAPKVWVAAGGGASMSFVSPLAPLLGFGVGLDSAHLRHGLRVMLTTEQKFELPPGSVVVQAWLATVLSCGRFTHGHFGAALCGSVDAAMLRASAEGYADGRSRTRPYAAFGLELQPSWLISDNYRISAAAGVVLPFTRESFSVIGQGVAYVPPPVSWRVLLFSEIGTF